MVLFSKYFFQARAKILNDYGYIWTHLQASTMILKIFFLQRYGYLTILKFSFKWVKVMLPYTRGGGLPVVAGGGQSDDS